jgi:hypothetical protein
MGLLNSVSMFADPRKRDHMGRSEIPEDVSREDIVAAFRSAMIGHFRSHIPGTNINESTLLASDYLNHFHELVMLLEAVATDPNGFAGDLIDWRPLTYEQHFTASGFRDKTLAIAAYRRAPTKIRARFDEAVAKLHAEAVTVIAEVATALKGRNKRRMRRACEDGVARLRGLIDTANTIATGESSEERVDPFADIGPQGAIDALFDTR